MRESFSFLCPLRLLLLLNSLYLESSRSSGRRGEGVFFFWLIKSLSTASVQPIKFEYGVRIRSNNMERDESNLYVVEKICGIRTVRVSLPEVGYILVVS